MLIYCLEPEKFVGIVTRLRAGRSGVRILVGARYFFFSKTCKPALVPAQLPIQWVPGLKWPGPEVNHSILCRG